MKKKLQISGVAVGAYLRVLRENRNMTPTEVAAALRTDATTVWRVENWKSDVRSSILFSFIRVVNGSVNDVELLMFNPNAKVQDGEDLAKQRIATQVI